MNQMKKQLQYGFTLIEMLLVMAIVSSLIYMSVTYIQSRTRSISIDRASLQMQQILNAGLSYYVNNSAWPTNIATLQTGGYLPTGGLTSPWGTAYTAAPSSSGLVFTVNLTFPSGLANANVIAQIVSGKLPFGVVTTTTIPANPPAVPVAVTNTGVSASVNIPGQNLNNMSTVSYTGLYHSGACVPAPSCPAGTGGATISPQIIVVPVSASGMSTSGSTDLYPIASFTAKAYGLTTSVTDTAPVDLSTGAGPASCGNDTSNPDTKCYADQTGTTLTNQITTGKYWRVCLFVTTAQGDVQWDVTTGQYATIMAITRCGSNTENPGSSFDVWMH